VLYVGIEESRVNELALVGLEWLGALALFLAFIAIVRYLEHRERMSMIEHGIFATPEASRRRVARGTAVLRGGLVTAGVGIAVTLGLYTLGYLLPSPFNAAPGRLGPWLLPGLIPTFVGLALIASYYLAPPRPESLDDTRDIPPSGDDQSDSDAAARRPGLRVVDAPSHPDDDRPDAARG
jgi:hypothetical protein